MREIKFEFWAGHTEKMITMKEAIEEWTLEFILRKSDTFKVRQYIGLKDKNGKEIYEGDIIDFWGALYKIVFNRGCFYMEDSTESDAVSWILDIKYHEISEVKGNIYENPNLLNND